MSNYKKGLDRKIKHIKSSEVKQAFSHDKGTYEDFIKFLPQAPNTIRALLNMLLDYFSYLIPSDYFTFSYPDNFDLIGVYDKETGKEREYVIANPTTTKTYTTEKNFDTSKEIEVFDFFTSPSQFFYTDISNAEYSNLRNAFPEIKISYSYEGLMNRANGAKKAFIYFFGIDILSDLAFSLLYNKDNEVVFSLLNEKQCEDKRKKKYKGNNRAYATYLNNQRYHGNSIVKSLDIGPRCLPLETLCKFFTCIPCDSEYKWLRNNKTTRTAIKAMKTNACYAPLLDAIFKKFPYTPWNCSSLLNDGVASVFERFEFNKFMDYINDADASTIRIKQENSNNSDDKSTTVFDAIEEKFMNHYLFEKLTGIHSSISVFNSLMCIPSNNARARFAYITTSLLPKMPFSYGRSHVLRFISENIAHSNNNLVLSPDKINDFEMQLDTFSNFDYHMYRMKFHSILTTISKASSISGKELSKLIIQYLSDLSKELKLSPPEYYSDIYNTDKRYAHTNKTSPYRKTFCNISAMMLESICRITTESVPKSLGLE